MVVGRAGDGKGTREGKGGERRDDDDDDDDDNDDDERSGKR